MEEFISLMKELQDVEKKKCSKENQKNSAMQNGTIKNSTNNQHKPDKKYLRTNSGRANACDVSINVESVYDISTAQVDYAKLEENAYEMAEESTAFMNAVRKSSRILTNYDSSDDEKVTSFSWSMPPSPEKASNPNPTTEDEIDFTSLPPPPPTLCNGDSHYDAKNLAIPPIEDESSVYSVINNDNTMPNHVNNEQLAMTEATTAIANGVLPANSNAISKNSLSSPPPVSPKPKSYSLSKPTGASEDHTLFPSSSPAHAEGVHSSPTKTSSLSVNLSVGNIPPPPPPLIPPPPAGVPPPPPNVLSSPPTSPYKFNKTKCKVKLRPFHWVPVPKQMVSGNSFLGNNCHGNDIDNNFPMLMPLV